MKVGKAKEQRQGPVAARLGVFWSWASEWEVITQGPFCPQVHLPVT